MNFRTKASSLLASVALLSLVWSMAAQGLTWLLSCLSFTGGSGSGGGWATKWRSLLPSSSAGGGVVANDDDSSLPSGILVHLPYTILLLVALSLFLWVGLPWTLLRLSSLYSLLVDEKTQSTSTISSTTTTAPTTQETDANGKPAPSSQRGIYKDLEQ